jgi:hypothetical protein
MNRLRTAALFAPLLLALLAAARPAAALTYPSDPAQALAQYSQLKIALHADTVPAQNLAAADPSLRGKTIEVRGRFLSTLNSQGADGKPQYVFLFQTLQGVSLTLRAGEPLVGIRLDEPVRVLASLPADMPDTEFQLQGLLRESDAPPDPPAPPAGASLTPAPSAPPPATSGPPPPPAPTVTPVWDGLPATPGAKCSTSDLPDVGLSQADINKWKSWVGQDNHKLTDVQLELTVRWVIAYSAIYGIDHHLSFAMIQAESDFDPLCRSWAGALGMTQIMYNELGDLGCSNPWNVQQNIRAGIRELSGDLRLFTGRSNYDQCILGLAAYNAGAGAVKKYGGVPPYHETQNYVVKVSKKFFELVQAGYP